MSWIRTVAEADAGGRLAEQYRKMADPDSGRVDHVLKVHSLHPDGLQAHWDLYVAAMKGTPTLRKVDREMIAVVVSQQNGCRY